MEEFKYKEEIISSRVGFLGGSDGNLLSSIAKLENIPESAKERLAICKGIYSKEEDIKTVAMGVGDELENKIFDMLQSQDERWKSNERIESKNLYCSGISLFGELDDTFDVRLATEEEKNKLFSALKEKGYVWNGKTKEVENIKKEHEFNPFDKVLVRDFEEDNWDINLFQEIVGEDIDYQFVCLSGCFNFCVPYEGNEELLGTSNSPKE